MARRSKKAINHFELPDLSAALDEATAGLAQIHACTAEHAEILRGLAGQLDEAIKTNDERWHEVERAAVAAVIARFRPLQDTLEACKKAIAEKTAKSVLGLEATS